MRTFLLSQKPLSRPAADSALQIHEQLPLQFISVWIFSCFSSEYVCNATDARLHTLRWALFNQLSIRGGEEAPHSSVTV